MSDERATPNTKSRSPRYPGIGLPEAVELVRKLWEKERRTTVAPDVAVKAFGHGGLSGSARVKLAALRQFDLVDDTKQGVRVSDLALEIMQHDEGTDAFLSAARRSAESPELFRQLLATFLEASNDALRKELLFRRGFAADAAEQLIKAFRDTVAYARLGQPTKVDPGGSHMSSVEGCTLGSEHHRPAHGLAGPGAGAYDPAEHRYCWPLPGGVTVEVRFTGPAGPVHFDFLRQYLELAKNAAALKETNDPNAEHEGQ